MFTKLNAVIFEHFDNESKQTLGTLYEQHFLQFNADSFVASENGIEIQVPMHVIKM